MTSQLAGSLTKARSLSWPYVSVPESRYYWGPVTASINWCEQNYAVTSYIAEFCNTTTNSVFLVLATVAIVNALRFKYERRILLTSLGYMLVGIGSWLFHMTLRYEYQLLDELPMIYTTLIMFWGMFEYKMSQRQSFALGVVTIALGVGITWYYLVNKDPVFHEVAYALLTISILIKSWTLAYYEIEDATAIKNIKYCAVLGASSFLTGFALWGVDQWQCSNLTRIRHWMGIPWGFIFELHGWWHVLTGLGVAVFITVLTYIRIQLLGRHDEFEMIFYARFWPVVVPKNGYKLIDNDHLA